MTVKINRSKRKSIRTPTVCGMVVMLPPVA
jgi:hypothetical protein